MYPLKLDKIVFDIEWNSNEGLHTQYTSKLFSLIHLHTKKFSIPGQDILGVTRKQISFYGLFSLLIIFFL